QIEAENYTEAIVQLQRLDAQAKKDTFRDFINGGFILRVFSPTSSKTEDTDDFRRWMARREKDRARGPR
ncbi:MAG: hypothetical protein AAF492_19850, partial [Verrucomicrobiota bacterium]